MTNAAAINLKPKLLVIELWGLGDLVIATPFIQAASEKYDVTVLAKPYAQDLQARFWPGVKVIPFHAPWTAFKIKDKYRFYAWPWRRLFRVRRAIREQHFAIGVSGRGESAGGDPRDHLLLSWFGVKRRIGFPRVGSQIFLTEELRRSGPEAHRYENWRVLARALGIDLPTKEEFLKAKSKKQKAEMGGMEEVGGKSESGKRKIEILVHSGAGQPVRVWPLERYRNIVHRLRQSGFSVQVACDPDQFAWWKKADEANVAAPKTVAELLALIDRAGLFIGNDSGPGHLAAFSGVPTFTVFGPQVPEWFAPLHPAALWVGGKACPYLPCSDYCRFAQPICLTGWSEEEIWHRLQPLLTKHVTE